MRNKRVLATIVSVVLGGMLFAASPYASIVYAEGSSFTLIRLGKAVSFKVDDPSTIGMEIVGGDIIRTGSSTFLEILINAPSASVQIAENTSFLCVADASGTQSSGELYYGRVRAKVAKLSGSSSFSLSSPSLTAGVRGTDFGLDVLAFRPAAGGMPSPMLFRVFCFEGSVLVGSATGTLSDTLIIEGNEMVERLVAPETEKTTPSESEPLAKTEVSSDVVDFWKVHPFAVISRLSVPVSAAPPANAEVSQSGAGVSVEKAESRNARLPYLAAVSLIGLGCITCATAAIWSTQVDSDARFIDPAYAAGGIMIGSGMVFAIIALVAD